ncbi:biotin-dependent carboxyltransferase family protein [Pseudomonas chlororaphis]|uniref:5-oxoprolinase subunit C family protein n=1 Tax=Pseudomonas chlororaphis TaxID=587753 RepID=UPI000F58071E|nr:biotin-dependent carboxyltransferase family protein [Pseudomonas chlororaphis]AZC49126.1 Allophanate hydrolase 2 subunit 2 [Pseudomonas chlororaphis subsp. piscium]AZC55755.1 Allophanate hydrolase 2 subunit 2 [Pseudomonas chlororaphis subsp. piscium]AZC74442.1 Allophanate hydrolase 2 subunit 2 [Pseudomonas chlororaphis subsp. piscium]AZC94264.1 Allophanate hydrolase 2 subunit 2 [Pseudomonas chlororaphis subsp. piscium]MBP5058721.1 biotin-dependent carboxyltransferase [Pseudomonas chlororaph
MSRLTIEASTPLCLLQDAGRFGVRHLGVTQGGALDWVSMSWANWLLGNTLDAPVIEITLGGFSVVAEELCLLALAGADLGACIDERPLSPGRSFILQKGQRLRFTQPYLGARAYLAAPGGFNAPKVLGSCASVVREELGGLDGFGRPLTEGARLEYSGAGVNLKELSGKQLPDLQSKAPLEVILGAQIGQFSGQSLFDAFNSAWTLDSRADRMGMRLLGPSLRYQGAPMISEGIPLGAIQVPPDGQPIVLLNDRQTIGGYPRLGALTPLALARLAQCLPGSEVRLTPVVQETAYRQQIEFLRRFV